MMVMFLTLIGYKYMKPLKAIVGIKEAAYRKNVSLILRKHNYRVFEVSEGSLIAKAFVVLRPSLVILGDELSDSRGIDIAFFIKNLTKQDDYQIILYSNKQQTELVKNVRARFIDEFVKIGDIKQLNSIVEQFGQPLISKMEVV